MTHMHLLLAEVQKPQRSVTSTFVSVVLHGGVIVLLATSGQQIVERVSEILQESVQLLLPVDRHLGPLAPGQASAASDAGVHTFGPSDPRSTESGRSSGRTPSVAQAGAPYTPWPANSTESEPAMGDGTYSVIDVDSVAERDPTSAAPEYPDALVLRRVEGKVIARFEVDSTGFVDMATARIVVTSHPLFSKAVVEALAKMKFRPARVGERPVRQLVEMPFIFRIERKKLRTS
jgi:protein TonB